MAITITKKYIHHIEDDGSESFTPLTMVFMRYSKRMQLVELLGGQLRVSAQFASETEAKSLILYIQKANEGISLNTPISLTDMTGQVVKIELQDDLDKAMEMTSTAHIDQVSGSQPSK